MQQALTPEAASVVKQAVTLARRRGHAQVTPLHVANTMLAASTGLLRTACLQSHSHPLQCKALELCFNVALNRLPASTSAPILAPHHSQYPSISNALVAAFKRAQAHQRRGSIENQQQPLLTVKIELEQLIISILDDPSVSRVMREAGFSSTQVKSNVEQAVSLEICSQTAPSVTSRKTKESNSVQAKAVLSKPKASDDSIGNEDIRHVINSLMNKRRRNFVIVGECLSTIEGVIRGVAEKFDKGDVPEGLREVKFITLSLSSLGHLSRAEIEQKLQELKSLVRGFLGREIILNLGDLAWATEYRGSSGIDEEARGYYSPVEHMIMDLSKLACGVGETGRFWLMGIATFQTYMRCKSGYPSLEAVWGLHPITIPVGSLSLSLITDSELQSESSRKKGENGVGEEETQLSCCADCSANFKMEADRSLQSSDDSTSNLPAWLQKYKDEQKAVCSSRDKDTVQIKNLCKKWNLICDSIHKSPYPSEKTLTFNPSVSPSSSSSGFSYDQQTLNLHHINHQWPVEPSLRLYTTDHHHHHYQNPNNPQTPFSSNPNSASSSDVMEMEYIQRFKEPNIENLTTLCTALESKVPWQKDVIPEIASTILRCRSGMVRRKGNKIRDNHGETKEETWLFFQGVDAEGKEKIARELARLVFGSQNAIVSIALSSFSSTRADSIEDCRNKRSRDEQSCSYIERFAEAVSSNPHRVFLVEDVEQADYCSQIGFKRAIERGRISSSNVGEVCLGDAIVILSCESFSSRSRACSPPVKQKSDEEEEKMDQQTLSLDLNISIDDESMDQDVESIDDIGLLESVDSCIVFRTQEL